MLAGLVYAAFILDYISKRIVAWHAMTTKVTPRRLVPLRVAVWGSSYLRRLEPATGMKSRIP
jgi:hypothetical protein